MGFIGAILFMVAAQKAAEIIPSTGFVMAVGGVACLLVWALVHDIKAESR